MKCFVVVTLAVLSTHVVFAQQFQERSPHRVFLANRGVLSELDPFEDHSTSQLTDDLQRVTRAIVDREGRTRNFRGRSHSRDDRNFVTRLVDELTRIARVGLNWFAPEPEVAPLECAATNGALDMGTCYSDAVCNSNGGVASGNCGSGGVCCIFPTVCGGIVSLNRTWFVNKDFPDYSRTPSDCRLTVKRVDHKVRQLRLDFVISELGDAVQGRCHRDSFTVRRVNDNFDLIPQLCGDNSGQHVYVEFGLQDLQLVLKMSESQRRKWHILVTQVAPGQEVPTGCLQYYTDRTATVKSLNYNSGSYLFKGDLEYDICFPSIESLNNRGGECQRKTVDVDLRQSENDIRTRRGQRTHSRRGRSVNLPIVQAFRELNNNNNRHNHRIRRAKNPSRVHPSRSRSMATSYSLRGDPVYSQIDHVMSQLKNPTSSGLESLLKSKSKLDAMGEEYGKKEGDDDAYYYYYYEDEDPNYYSNNDLDHSDDHRVTDNYAVEHVHREFVLLPDGSPVPSNIFNNNRDKGVTTATIYNGDKYFHTGMLDDITKHVVTESYYPTPTWYQRPTTPKVNLLKPELPVASIMVYDPLKHISDDDLVYADPYNKEAKPILNNSPTQFTLTDLTTLSNINSEDEYNLKHDGNQWIFKKNADKTTIGPQSIPNKVLPHGIKLSTDSVTGNKPHLVFKHPSGTVTEMHISPGNSNNSKEKIITVIETGPISQNFTKIKINDISELDKVIENVFGIIGESSKRVNVPITDTTQSNYPKTTFSAFSNTQTGFQSPETTFYTSLNPEDLKLTTANGIDEDLLTSIYNTRLTGKPHGDATRVSIHRLKNPTSHHGEATHIVTRPHTTTRFSTRPTAFPHTVTRFSPKPSSNAVRLTTSQYQSTTPSSATTQFNSPRPSSTIRYTRIPSSQRPVLTELKRRPITRHSLLPTAVPTNLYTMITDGNVRTPASTTLYESPLTETEEPEVEAPGNNPTISSIIMQSNTVVDPFTEMLNSIGVETATPEPIFTISTKANGKLTTKSYTTVEEAVFDLNKITTQSTAGVSASGLLTTKPGSLHLTTMPLSSMSETEPTQNPFGETTIPEDLKNLIANSDHEDVAYFNNDVCGDSYMKVNSFKICDDLLRSVHIRDEAKDLFSNMERISVRSLGDSILPLRFSLTYQTTCLVDSIDTTPIRRATTYSTHTSTTTGAPQVKTINLLQYLLGWYR